MAFESAFKATDNTQHFDDVYSPAHDCAEQPFRVLILKYFDDLELTCEQAAENCSVQALMPKTIINESE